MDDDDEFWDVACRRIKAKYFAIDEGKQKPAKMERKIRKTILILLSVELAEIYRMEPTGSKMLDALTRRYTNRSSTVAVLHKLQRLEEDLRHCRYNVTEDIEVHLRKMRNKQLELDDLGHMVSFTTVMMYVLQGLPAKIDEFALIQAQIWCRISPASNTDELEEQIRTACSRYQIRRSSLTGDERDACGHKTKAIFNKMNNR